MGLELEDPQPAPEMQVTGGVSILSASFLQNLLQSRPAQGTALGDRIPLILAGTVLHLTDCNQLYSPARAPALLNPFSFLPAFFFFF